MNEKGVPVAETWSENMAKFICNAADAFIVLMWLRQTSMQILDNKDYNRDDLLYAVCLSSGILNDIIEDKEQREIFVKRVVDFFTINQ